MSEKYPLPDGWRWVRLGEVCEINPPRPKGFTRHPDAPTTFVPMASVHNKIGTITEPQIVPYRKVSKGYTYFEENDVLFAKITPCMQNGKHVIAKNLIDRIGFGTTEFHVIRPNAAILSEWIHFFIRQTTFLQEATAYFTGAVGQQRVPDSFLSNYTIPLPPVEDQKRIISKIQELMQEVERARAACKEQLEAARALPAAYLREVFESEEAKKWEKKRLGEVVKEALPGFACGKRASRDGFIQLRMNNISNRCKLDLSSTLKVPATKEQIEKYRLMPGDVIFNNTNSAELVGKTALFNEEEGIFLYSNHLTRLRTASEALAPFYLASWLQLQWYRRVFEMICNRWIGQAAVHREMLLNFEIPLPPLSEQKRIASKIQDLMQEVEKLQSAIQNQQSALDALPQAILRKAFRGEL